MIAACAGSFDCQNCHLSDPPSLSFFIGDNDAKRPFCIAQLHTVSMVCQQNDSIGVSRIELRKCKYRLIPVSRSTTRYSARLLPLNPSPNFTPTNWSTSARATPSNADSVPPWSFARNERRGSFAISAGPRFKLLSTSPTTLSLYSDSELADRNCADADVTQNATRHPAKHRRTQEFIFIPPLVLRFRPYRCPFAQASKLR